MGSKRYISPDQTGAPRDLQVCVQRKRVPPLPWLWMIMDGENLVATSEEGFVGAEEAWLAARREVLRRTATPVAWPTLRQRRP